jgi:ankyrin repeat protein
LGKRYDLARRQSIDLPIIVTNFIPAALAAAAAGGHVDIAELCLPRPPQDRRKVDLSLLNRLPRSKSKGWGPLHWAASNGHLAVTDFLIAHGVSVLDKAFDGSTAADLARRHGHDEIEVFLERQGELELQRLKLDDNYQPQDPRFNLRISGMLASAIYLIHEANIFTVVAAQNLIMRDIFCKCRELQPFLRISIHA